MENGHPFELGTGTATDLGVDPQDDLEADGLTTTPSRVETREPSVIQVCTDCSLYWNPDSEWNHCPKCGEDLEEVSHA
jgi:hypothetical protein